MNGATKLLCGLVLALLLEPLVACAAPMAVTFSGQTMGTTYSVKAFLPTDADTQQIERAIVEELADINAKMSTYLPESEVSRFNRARENEWFSVSGETAYVVHVAQRTSEKTNGAFDVTVNPLVELWSFGTAAGDRDEGTVEPPSKDALAAVLARVGYRQLEVELQPPRLRKRVAGLEIDLSAIAKGYAVDRIWQVLNDWGGIDSCMIEVGGEVRVHGSKPDGQPWSIAIESPLLEVRKPELVLAARDMSIASSGDYRNFFEHDGRLYSHTIDPRTGRSVSHPLSGVTVTSMNCIDADALATALMVMGPTEGLAWCEANGVSALFLTRKDGAVVRQQSSHFEVPELSLAEPNADGGGQLGTTILIAIIVFGFVLVAMSVGVILQGKRLQGSCGGLAGMKDSQGRTICDACTNPSPQCGGQPPVEREEGVGAASDA